MFQKFRAKIKRDQKDLVVGETYGLQINIQRATGFYMTPTTELIHNLDKRGRFCNYFLGIIPAKNARFGWLKF